ncbi:MAG: cysteine desulfurase [Pelagibacterium sp. SCN 64-44]|nr:MAG: cysteine desulfurase [Pelagibacterium sp. SCN 64-44]
MTDPDTLRAQFPILSRTVHDKPLVYLDTASSAQKPRCVIEAVTRAYEDEYSNVHRGLHFLSNQVTEAYEEVRSIVARFLNAPSEEEIVFTSGATAGINLVSYSWAAPRLEPGDEIVLSSMEHHANTVPWHFLRERQGVVLKWVECDATGYLDPERIAAAIGPKTRLVAVTHMSNILGTETDVAAICALARARGVPVLVDGSQTAVHLPVDVQAIGCDFYAVTGHKLYGPSGSGAIFIRRERLEQMRPFFGGGDMVREVSRETITYAGAPIRFEAGTPAIVPQIGFGVALEFLMTLGMQAVRRHEETLRDHALRRLKEIDGLTLLGTAPARGPLFSFVLDRGPSPQNIAMQLDAQGIAVRAGTFCSRPILQQLGLSGACRASLGLYNTPSEIDLFCDAIRSLS